MINSKLQDYLNGSYPHIDFPETINYSKRTAINLGQCETAIKVMAKLPIQPQYRDKLLRISLIKGAQATTAIEGNTLSEDEIKEIIEGKSLPASKEYQEIEVKNVLEAYNGYLHEVLVSKTWHLITPQLLRDFHSKIGKNLGEHFEALPGQFRKNNVFISTYRPPDYNYVEDLMEEYCEWLKRVFHYDKQKQTFYEFTIEAIVSHIYLALIHPFGDGNGRTARLLEFYILLRGGVPVIATYVLSNFYNETRPEYYRHLSNVSKTRDMSGFIDYAVQGFSDGLHKILDIYINNLLEITWHKHIYDKFSEIQFRKGTFKRKRGLILNMPTDREYSIDEIVESNTKITKMYAGKNRKTIARDLKELQALGLLVKERSKYKANIDVINNLVFPSKSTK